MWWYVKQVNRFFRIEDRAGKEARIVCFVENEGDAKRICQAVNKTEASAKPAEAKAAG